MVKEFNGEADHVHILLDYHPDNNLSAFIGSMKAASSRIVKSEFKDAIDKYYWKDKFWSDSYCVVSCGGAPLQIVKQYIHASERKESGKYSTVFST